jgi:hypothetical protein
VHPQWHLVYAAHLGLAVGAGLLALVSAPAGFALALLVATSLYLDLNTRFYLLRRLFFRRASQNVLSRGGKPDAPARLIICAHYDAARTGWVYGERSTRSAARVPRRARVLLGPMRIVFWSTALLVPLLGARLAGVDGRLLAIAQLVLSAVLVISLVLLVDIALSDIVPGANDNASGVAVALALGRSLDADPPAHLDVWLLLTGAEECIGEGMREFVRGQRTQLASGTTYVLAIDSVGFGNVHYISAEGLAVSYAMDPRLVALCKAIADADREGAGRFAADAVRSPFLTDATPAAIAGHRAIALTGLDDRGLPPATYHTPRDTPERVDQRCLVDAHDFALELVRQIDRDVARQASAMAQET